MATYAERVEFTENVAWYLSDLKAKVLGSGTIEIHSTGPTTLWSVYMAAENGDSAHATAKQIRDDFNSKYESPKWLAYA